MNNITGVLESNPEIVFLFTGLLFQEFSTILLNFHWNLSYFFAWAAIFSSIRVPRCFQQRLIFAFQNQIRLRKKLKNSKHHNTRESQLNVGPTNIGPASIDLPPGFVYFCFRSSKVSTPTFSSNYVNTIKKNRVFGLFLIYSSSFCHFLHVTTLVTSQQSEILLHIRLFTLIEFSNIRIFSHVRKLQSTSAINTPTS